MEIIVPVGIIIYILVSVLGAVFKSLSSERPPVVEAPFGDSDGPREEQESKSKPVLTRTETGQPVILYEREKSDTSEKPTKSSEKDDIEKTEAKPEPVMLDEELDKESVDEESQVSDYKDKPVAGSDFSKQHLFTKEKLVSGIIMSELLREPRAKRPWPSR